LRRGRRARNPCAQEGANAATRDGTAPAEGPGMITLLLVTVAALLALLVVLRPEVTRARGGKVLAFLALFVLPLLAMTGGLGKHVERSKTTEFCISCHAMTDHGRSLHIDDPRYLPAAHWQNGRVPRETACFTCHTNYTMYGDYKAKLHGLKHVWVQYMGKKPGELHLYEPYNNRECLHCHAGTRTYTEESAHQASDVGLARLEANQVSCLKSGCHDKVHAVNQLSTLKLWNPPATSTK
jgi:cytochrome c-type protein NapC